MTEKTPHEELAELMSDTATETRRKEAFDKWLASPIVRMTTSMIPAGENQDALKVLLREAFNLGCAVGRAESTAQLVASVITLRMNKE